MLAVFVAKANSKPSGEKRVSTKRMHCTFIFANFNLTFFFSLFLFLIREYDLPLVAAEGEGYLRCFKRPENDANTLKCNKVFGRSVDHIEF